MMKIALLFYHFMNFVCVAHEHHHHALYFLMGRLISGKGLIC